MTAVLAQIYIFQTKPQLESYATNSPDPTSIVLIVFIPMTNSSALENTQLKSFQIILGHHRYSPTGKLNVLTRKIELIRYIGSLSTRHSRKPACPAFYDVVEIIIIPHYVDLDRTKLIS